MADTNKVKKKSQNIEVMRFIGILMIMNHHLYHIGYTGGGYPGAVGWVWVDFFFIVTGVFTYSHFENQEIRTGGCATDALMYTFLKFRSIYPLCLIMFLIEYCLEHFWLIAAKDFVGLFTNLANYIQEIFWVTSAGMGGPLNAPTWFLSAMFIVMPLMIYLMTAHREWWKIVSFMAPILYFGYKGVNTDRAWPNDMVRAFCCMALGTLAYMLADHIQRKLNKSEQKISVILTGIEIVAVGLAIYLSVINSNYLNFFEVLFLVIVTLMISGVTLSGRFSFTICEFLGEMSMPMFLIHWVMGTCSYWLSDDIYKRTIVYYLGTIFMSMIYIILQRVIRGKMNEQ